MKRCCIVLSNLSGSYEGATKQLRQAIRNFEQEANRQARAITPVDLASEEIYDILRKRLFRRLPEKSVIEAVASAYAQVLSEAARSKSIAKSSEVIAEEIHGSYPFHPSVKHVIALFKENESYRQTRGLMQFVSKMIKSAWTRATNDVYLIGCQHLDLNIGDVREEINRISNLQGAIAHDIAAGGTAAAEVVDTNQQNDAASQTASLHPDRLALRVDRRRQGVHQAADARVPDRARSHRDRIPGRVRGASAARPGTCTARTTTRTISRTSRTSRSGSTPGRMRRRSRRSTPR